MAKAKQKNKGRHANFGRAAAINRHIRRCKKLIRRIDAWEKPSKPSDEAWVAKVDTKRAALRAEIACAAKAIDKRKPLSRHKADRKKIRYAARIKLGVSDGSVYSRVRI